MGVLSVHIILKNKWIVGIFALPIASSESTCGGDVAAVDTNFGWKRGEGQDDRQQQGCALRAGSIRSAEINAFIPWAAMGTLMAVGAIRLAHADR